MTEPDPASHDDPTIAPSNNDQEATHAPTNSYEESGWIGPYRLLQMLGEGGMGTVWMAEQEKPVRRRVALKLIKPGLAEKSVIARFEAERQALAMMNHQNIAQVLDAGTTKTGVPYFVMELVKGIPVSKYCDRNKLGIRERLELFIPICNAVQHAHQKGILHRDLKPSNVLVTIQDGVPVPKVIDFGLAKAVQHTTLLTDKTVFTEFGKVVGTVQYMSPEQAETGVMDVDTRTDIYSLGVMLYELLTGSTPIEKKTIAEGTLLYVLELVREKEPPKPSTRLVESGDSMSGISEQRKIGPSRLQQILRGELDWIVMKAIEKDRNRRYSSASGFAEDISRFLNDEPVIARPPTLGYLTSKFVKKNRGLVAATTLIAASLVGGIVGTSWFAMKAVEERQTAVVQRERADEEAQRAKEAESLAKENEKKAVKAFSESEKSAKRSFDVLKVFTDAFQTTDPNAGANADMRAKDVLVNVQDALQGSDLDDEGQSLLRRTLTKTFLSLGEFETAMESAKLEIETRSRLFGVHDPLTNVSRGDLAIALDGVGRTKEAIEILTPIVSAQKKETEGVDYSDLANNLGNMHIKLGQFKKAETLLKDAYAMKVETLGAVHQDALTVQNSLANVNLASGNRQKAVEITESCLDLLTKNLGTEHPSTLVVKTNLANFYQQAGEFKKALSMLQETYEAKKRKLGEEHPQTLRSMNSLGACLDSLGRTKEALKIHQKEFEISRRILGENHPDTLLAMNSLALIYQGSGAIEKAIELLKNTKAGYEKVYGPKHPETLRAVNNLGTTLMDDFPEQSLPLLERAAKGRAETLGLKNPATIVTRNNLAILYGRLGKEKEALAMKVENLKLMTELLGPDHPNTMVIMSGVATAYKKQGDFKESIELFEESMRRRKSVLGLKHPYTLRAFDDLRNVYQAANEVEKFAATAEEQLAVLAEMFPDRSTSLASVKAAIAAGYIDLNIPLKAKTLLEESYSYRNANEPEHWTTFNTQSMLGGVLIELKQFDDAATILETSYNGLEQTLATIPESVRAERISAAVDRLIDLAKARHDEEAKAKWSGVKKDLPLESSTQN